MKYDCSNEFDLNEIYRKLTAPLLTPPQNTEPEVKFSLAVFQRAIDALVLAKQIKR